MEGLRRRSAARLPRLALGIAWRSARTIVFHGALGLAVFLLASLLIRRSDPPAWASVFYPLYVLAGILVAGYVGLLTALRRETQAIVATLTGYLGTLASSMLDDLALPSAGVEPARLRRVTEARVPVPSGGRLAQAATNFAVARAVEAAGLAVLRERLISLADDAERRGSPLVARHAVEAVAREAIGVAVARRLTLGWTATRAVALGFAFLLLLSLPVAVVVAD